MAEGTGELTYEVDRNSQAMLYETTDITGERNERASFSNRFGKLCMPHFLVEMHMAPKHARNSEDPCFLLKFLEKDSHKPVLCEFSSGNGKEFGGKYLIVEKSVVI